MSQNSSRSHSHHCEDETAPGSALHLAGEEDLARNAPVAVSHAAAKGGRGV